MKSKKFELKSNDLVKHAIIFLLFRYNNLTAKEIQEKLGLKRQTAYNYLNELVEKNEIGTEETFLPANPNVKTIIFTYKRRNPVPINYKMRLKDIFKDKTPESIRNELNNQIKMSIASLIETMSSINHMDNDQLKYYIQKSEFGPGIDMLLLSDDEYSELGSGIQEVLSRLWKKWELNKDSDNKNLFHIGGFESIDKN